MLVSVIIPSYNHQHYVSQAITSVLDQTWPEIDLIVIDDASSDDSASVIRKIFNERGGFRFIHREKKMGLISSLNQGLKMAKGKYFCELASDDFLPLDSIEKRIRFFTANHNNVAVFADAVLVKDNMLTDSLLLDDKRRCLFKQSDPLLFLLKGVLPIFSTGMFRTEILKKIGGFDSIYRCYEDLEMPILLCSVGKVGCMDEPVLCRREHAFNTSSITATIRTDKILCYEKLLCNSDLIPYSSLIHYQLRRSYLALGRHLSSNKGGSNYERRLFQNAWPYALKDIRLLWHLLKWGRKQNI